MATTERYVLGSQTTLITTTGTMLTNALYRGASYDNRTGNGGGDGYTLCDLEFVGQWATAPAAGTAISVWFLGSQDGTNYEDGDGSGSGGTDVTPARLADATLPLRNVTTAQRTIRRNVLIPWGQFLPLLKNDATGQTMALGATLKIRPVTAQGA